MPTEEMEHSSWASWTPNQSKLPTSGPVSYTAAKVKMRSKGAGEQMACFRTLGCHRTWTAMLNNLWRRWGSYQSVITDGGGRICLRWGRRKCKILHFQSCSSLRLVNQTYQFHFHTWNYFRFALTTWQTGSVWNKAFWGNACPDGRSVAGLSVFSGTWA